MPFLTGHALVIGVGSYANVPTMNVPITAADANAVAAVLKNVQFCGYPESQVALLSDDTATRDDVLAALDALAARVSEGDTVLVFYAGHGEYGDDGYYLTTHDTQMANGKVVSNSGLREADVIAKLRAIKAKRLLLLVNACHAGEISPVLATGEKPPTGTPLPPQTAAALLGTGEGRMIISACRDGQFAFIGPGPLTLFTQALMDGLQGKGVSSNRGYVSVFDLYTHLYYALDEAVPRVVDAADRAQYGEKQEPELTILKGVGPFPVALWRGSAALDDFDASATPPEGAAVREVNPAYSQAMLRQHQQSIGGNAQVGVAVAGDVHGGINLTTQGDNVAGDKVGGDKVAGDISGSSGIAIGRGARSTVRNVNTGGGDYSEGNIDKRKGTFVNGDQFNMSVDFRGSILNIKSTLDNLTQSIGASAQGDAATKDQLKQLIAQLSAELQKVPAEQAAEAEQAAKRAESAVTEATKPQPDKDAVEYSLSRLQKAAENIGKVLPAVLPIAVSIADAVRRMAGM